MIKITIKAARINAGLNQVEAAKRLDISPSTLIKWEQRPDQIPGYRLHSISEVYGIPVDNLIFLPKD